MKSLIKNDEAISVVVGAILILAVMVTFMSVFTSSWVPIYEGDAEADHSDTTQRTFMDLYKQIESAEKTTNSVTIDLGTDDMSFVKNSYSVGYLEVNETAGNMYVTTTLTRDVSQSFRRGEGFDIVDLNTSHPAPFTNFSFDFTQLDFLGSVDYPTNGNDKDEELNSNFMVKMWTTSMSRWITLYPYSLDSNDKSSNQLGIMIKYYPEGNGPTQFWQGSYWTYDQSGGGPNPDLKSNIITVHHPNVHIDLLEDDYITLIEPATLEINGTTYTASDTNNNTAPLHDVFQHYMKLPGDGNGSNYELDYTQYDGILEVNQHITYENTDGTVSEIGSGPGGSNTSTQFYDSKVGGGTLTMRSDYNFMVDQSFVLDCGAVFLVQEDGSVLKVNPPVVATSGSDGNLNIVINSAILKGDLQTSGNGVETLYTALSDVDTSSGSTNNITIVKETSHEYYKFWKPFFDKLNSSANSFSNITATLTNNTAETNMTLIINDTSSTKKIDVSINTKVIEIS